LLNKETLTEIRFHL